MSQPRALVLVFVAWALIYLPGLGTREIKGEEGRRILPAITMLQTGNFIVPHVGSDPYFTKPPLVNWMVAASFKFFGARNEWTARVSSVLCVLLVAVAFVTVARASLGENGSLAAALIWLTNFGIIEKGRLIEIEALYVSLTALAFVCWMSWWQTARWRWLTWTVPWIFLGLGWLAKGPLHLVFFYSVVVGVLVFGRDERRPGGGPAPSQLVARRAWSGRALAPLFSAPHFLGVAIMLGIFAAWAIPCLLMMQASNVTDVWARQFSGRLSGEDFKLSGWLMNIPRGLGYFLPWVLLFFFGKHRHRGLLFGIAIAFLIVSLLPGALPRYTMPLLGAACWVAAVLLEERKQLRLALVVTAITAVALVLYGFAITPLLKKREKVRPLATQINAALPAGEPLYAVDPDYQPFLFYVREPIIYVSSAIEVPSAARYVLVQPAEQENVVAKARGSAQELLRLRDYRNKEVALYRIGAGP